MPKLLILMLLVLPYGAFAQFTISGKVLSHDNSRPIENVSVFLNNATIGDQTSAAGSFTLKNVRPGTYDLIVSIIGFSTYSQSITITNANIKLPDIYLSPKAVNLSEVKITAKSDPDWPRNFELFKNNFLGTSDLAKACKIINPELLDLSYDEKTKTLTGKSVDFLIIENKALGYRVKYLLSNFMLSENDSQAKQFAYEGVVAFEELNGTSSQTKQWQQRREEVYANSITHFLRAARDNKLNKEGFSVLRLLTNPQRPGDNVINDKIKQFAVLGSARQFKDSLSFWEKKSRLPKLLTKQMPVALTGEDVIERTDRPDLSAFGCAGDALYITYDKLRQFNAVPIKHLTDLDNAAGTLITFNAPFALFDNNGTIANTGSLTFSGAWANKRVAELLPLDYEPPKTEVLIDKALFVKIDTSLKGYFTGREIEKVYLHLDKPYYAAGDTIYFKAYVTDQLYQPTALSGILNVELINPNNQIYRSIKLKLKDGMAAGDFALADTLERGGYKLRAYTNLMRNAGEDYFFNQHLSIVNGTTRLTRLHKAAKMSASRSGLASSTISGAGFGRNDVQFFPEGGNPVNGVASKVAFKAIAPNGLGIDLKGTITDEQGHEVSTFTSWHLGMGFITITPQSGKRYQAHITFADSTKAIVDLPQADDTGYALNVDNSDPRNVVIAITAGQQNHHEKINLIAQAGSQIYYYTTGKMIDGKFKTNIPKTQFPDGIAQFTLFSESGEPVNERLVFIQNHSQLNLKLAAERQVYTPRQKVKVNLNTGNQYQRSVTGNFSVAVIDETKVPVDENKENTILTDLLLTSDLKGYVESPNYYFNERNSKASNDLDVLMLTQGYHRFEWKQILKGDNQPAAFQPEQIMSVSGKIKTLSGKPVPHAKVSLMTVANVYFSLDTVADDNGRFVFEHLPVRDSIRYVIQATDNKLRRNTLIELDNVTPPKIGKEPWQPYATVSDSTRLATYLNSSRDFHQEQIKHGIGKHAIELKEVIVKEKIEQKHLHYSSNLNGPGRANEVITADQLSQLGCPFFLDCIKSRLHGIDFTGGEPYYHGFRTLVMIDGVEIQGLIEYIDPNTGKKIASGGPSKKEILSTLNTNDIASIEVITSPSYAAIYGSRGAGGVILITTKRASDNIPDPSTIKTHYAYYTPVGYYKARAFYSPQYDVQKTNVNFPDLRTTIYWNPNIITDEKGNTSFEFFNADNKGDYRIIVEGMDDKGHLGRQVYRYKVE